MANPHRGEVSFEVGDDTYTLSYSANALAELEEKLGCGVNEIGALMSDPAKIRMTTIRTIFWAGLLDSHPDMDEKTMKGLLSKVKPTVVVDRIAKAFTLAFPEAQSEASADPQTPSQGGTG